MNRLLDAAVLGAGVAGGSLAKFLADRGWETVLIDRAQFPRNKVCGEFLSPEALRMLDSLGLREAVEALRPSLIERARISAGRSGALDIPLPGTALGISRFALDDALHRAARQAGAEVHTATTVTSVRPCEEGFLIEAKRGGAAVAYRARTAIAAWGAGRRPGMPGSRANEKTGSTLIGVKSHFRGIAAESAVELYFFDGGYLGIAPIEGGLVNVAALLKRQAFESKETSVLAWIDAACRKHPRLCARMASAVPVPGTQAAVAPVALNGKPVAWDMIALAGDAAVMIPPLCGDGMSMALRSSLLCASLADKFLAGTISLSAWRHDYSEAIRREFRGPLRWGRLLQRLFGAPFVPGLLLHAAHFAPGLAAGAFKRTRLKEWDS